MPVSWLAGLIFAALLGLVTWSTITQSLDASTVGRLTEVLVIQGVVLVGLALKEGLDRRSADIAEIAEQRLNVETSLKAVGLIEGTGPTVTYARNGGITVALVGLGQTALAISLIESLWPEGIVTDEAASQVVDAAFQHLSAEIQTTGAAVLAANVARVVPREGSTHYVPGSVTEEWNLDLPRRARLSLLAFLVHGADHLAGPDSPEIDHEVLMTRLNLLVRMLNNLLDQEDIEEELIVNTANHLLLGLLAPYMADDTMLDVPGPGDNNSDLVALFQTVRARKKGAGMVHGDLYPISVRVRKALTARFPSPYPERRPGGRPEHLED